MPDPTTLLWVRLIDGQGTVIDREPAANPQDARDLALLIIGRVERLENGFTLSVRNF